MPSFSTMTNSIQLFASAVMSAAAKSPAPSLSRKTTLTVAFLVLLSREPAVGLRSRPLSEPETSWKSLAMISL